MLINGKKYDSNIIHQHLYKFKSHGKRSHVTSIIIHETTTTSFDKTIDVLKKRESGKLGAHFIVDEFGNITQHNDVKDILFHAGSHNSSSIGIEVVSPYYPEYIKKGMVWKDIIDASWAHKKKYVLPTIKQCESLYSLIRAILDTNDPYIKVPIHFPNIQDGYKFYIGASKNCEKPTSGIYCHHNIGNHADGSFLLFYTFLREMTCNSAEISYKFTIEEMKSNKTWIDISKYINSCQEIELPELPWTEEDEIQVMDLCPGTYESLTSEPICK